MVDLHCHILAGIDDGAVDMSESLRMAKKAVEEGIHTIVATPHYISSQYQNPKQRIMAKVEELNQALRTEKIDLEILPGQEPRIDGELIQGYESGEIITLADTQYLFIEFPANHVPRYTEQLFFDLQINGFIPVIVHPERNQELIERPELLYQLVKKGALTQITASSVCGVFGKKVKAFAHQLVEYNLTHFIASDAHNTRKRTFKLKDAYHEIASKFGDDMVYFFKENAELLIDGQNVMKEIPERIKKKKFLNLF